MTTLGESLGMHSDPRRWGKSDRLADNNAFLGIEIELEHLRHFGGSFRDKLYQAGLWTLTEDGSLRDHGLEFIMQTRGGEPLKGADVIRALDTFKAVMSEYIGHYDDPPSCSSRTSIHVHVDVRDLDFPSLKKFILLYLVFEKIFFNWSSPDRYCNAYCRSTEIHYDVLERFAQILEMDDAAHQKAIRSISSGNKYDAMNVLSIRKRGSIEFRMMGGTYDTERILKWVNMLLAMRIAAQDDNLILDEFPEHMSQRGLPNLIDQVFGKWGTELKPHATDLDVLEGLRLSQEVLMLQPSKQLNKTFLGHSAKDHSHLKAFAAQLED